MITASTDIEHFISRLRTLMAAKKRSETNCHTRPVTGDDYRLRLLDLANERNRKQSRY